MALVIEMNTIRLPSAKDGRNFRCERCE